ncbi:hypothetical protein AG0111_0g12852 [Alternaria gaisen]|uniref:Uncharacterized protein n=1 Tax=Alternaria gaisen TaxID=167740 RepID=A0ACB6F3B3_9PLEO|nr:hypothetical protein AG0111_0g12852 [Alternaria gaisen]
MDTRQTRHNTRSAGGRNDEVDQAQIPQPIDAGRRPEPSVLERQDERQSNASDSPPPRESTVTPEEGYSDPEGAILDAQLARLRTWKENQLKRLELARLQKLYDRVESGDIEALEEELRPESSARPAQSSSTSGLPRPEPPQVFSKTNRAQYNRWERDCESYFLRVPQSFTTEIQRVDFGAMYISEPLKTLWQAHKSAERHKSPTWTPMWVDLKAVMLNALGSPQERKQRAYDLLKHAHQRPSQNPTDLLDFMRPLWEELGSDRTLDVQVLEYTAALREDIRKSLLLLPIDRRSTLPQVEEHANLIFRQKNQAGEQRQQPSKKDGPRPTHDQDKSRGAGKTSRNAKRARVGYSNTKRGKIGRNDTVDKSVTCYGCGEPGHYKTDCPKADKADKSLKTTTTPKSGKDWGRRN